MNSTSMDAEKRCRKCLEYVNIHITCFKCDAVYHIYCWKKVPGAYLNQTGQLFCCHAPTSNYASIDTNLRTQENPPERVTEKGKVDCCNEDLENCLIKEEASEWNEFKCDACLLEFTNKEYLENHFSKCFYKEREFIHVIKEDKDLWNCVIKEEAPEWNEFKCDSCHLKFTYKEHLENHYIECLYKEGEFIQELREDKGLENRLHKEEELEWNKFQCDACLLEFTNKEYLENHYRECPYKAGELNKDKAGLVCSSRNEENIQTEPYVQQCELESSYSQFNKGNDTCVTDTKRNPSVHTKKKPFKCDTCGFAAVRKFNLEAHILAKHSNSEKQYKCEHCKYTTFIKRCLEEHNRIHSNEKQFKCDMCDYAATRKSYLNYHKLNHSNAEKRYKCSECKYSTYAKNNLTSHMRTHTKERPFKCDTCEYAAARSNHLKNHILTRHSNTEKGYRCENCEYSSYKEKDLLNHMHKHHTNERQFKCDRCDYATVRKWDLRFHILGKHSNKVDKRYKCIHCEWSTHLKWCLVEHKRIHITPYKCDMCNYAAVDEDNLKLHISSKHSNAEKKYKCTDCEYSTYTKAWLVIHNRTHTKERPFKCDMCEYAAVQRGTLNFHILTKHSNAEKQYKCEHCKYSAHTKHRLLNHERIHTNERPFKCGMCDYAAIARTPLTIHISRRHSEAKKGVSAVIANIPLKEKSVQ